MTTASKLDIKFEALGSQPNFRQDWILPLRTGRVELEGVNLSWTGPHENADLFNDPKFKNGEFGLLDTNLGDVIPAIDAGWDFVCLPVLIKRKPVFNYFWVRTDRGINSPKDLEGKTIAATSWGVVTTFSRGFLEHDFGVDLSKVKWIVGPSRWPLYKQVQVDFPAERKRPEQRLLEGEADARTGDITDAKAWADLEGSPQVRRLFPDYQEVHKKMYKERGILTPSHIILMGGKTHRDNPGLSRRIYDAFLKSHETAYSDLLGDGTSYSLIMDARELVKDQMKEMGDPWKPGIKANKNTMDTLLDFYYEQGQTQKRLSFEQVFANDTLDT